MQNYSRNSVSKSVFVYVLKDGLFTESFGGDGVLYFYFYPIILIKLEHTEKNVYVWEI